MQNQTTLSPLRCNPLLYGSLFSGIGGIDLGFDRAGLKCAWQVEIDPFARKVLEKHWPGVPKHDDIRTFKPTAVDVVCGGFPCQDISYAGKGAGLQGERSGLFYEAMRIVCEVGPRFVVLENVSALLVRGLDEVLGTLASIGYDAEWDVLSAAAFGLPHYRERVFVVGYFRDHEGIRRWPAERTFQRIDPDDSRVRAEQFVQNFPLVVRSNDGVPRRVDGRRGLGNSVVPAVAEWIGRRLIESV